MKTAGSLVRPGHGFSHPDMLRLPNVLCREWIHEFLSKERSQEEAGSCLLVVRKTRGPESVIRLAATRL